MNRIKSFLVNTLGVFGLVLYFCIAYLFQFAPLVVLDFHFLIFIVVFFCLTCLPIIGTILNFVLWIWALVVTINGPQDWFAILYYIIFAINTFYVAIRLLPSGNRRY